MGLAIVETMDQSESAPRGLHDAGPFSVPRLMWVLAGLFLGTTALGAWQMANYQHTRLFELMLAQGVLYAISGWWILRGGTALDRRAVLAVILGSGLLARAMLLPMPPVSTDVYRYVWDGRVQSE